MFPPSALSTNTVAAPPPTPPCEDGKPSDGFRLLLLSVAANHPYDILPEGSYKISIIAGDAVDCRHDRPV